MFYIILMPTNRKIVVVSDYSPGREVFTLCKGKIRHGEINSITAKLKKENEQDISDIHSVTIWVTPTTNFEGETIVIDGNRKIDHFIFFNLKDAIDSISSEILQLIK